MRPIIKIENLSKRYRLGKSRVPYTTLRERLSRGFFSRRAEPEEKWFWALRDVSLTVAPGEVVGIIGRNGAGKSTLLKVLSRITEPTGGRAELFGRTASLLEVGTGFHPELTGRENIFLNGAILGMKRDEIAKKFDEIVAFAEIEKFLDTPVKHYSSGMYVRLAFAVAAHLEPDILVIDEVLAVGDAQFQKKCLGKVKDAASHGRTVLFISHDMAAVESLCRRVVVLEQGKVIFTGDQRTAITRYLESVSKNLDANLRERTDRIGSGEIRVTAIEIKDARGNALVNALCGQDINIYFHFETSPDYRQRSNVNISFMVRTALDVPVFLQHNLLTGKEWGNLPPVGAFVCRLRRLPLPPASYRIGFSVMCGDEHLDRIDDAAELGVIEGDFFGSGKVPAISHGCCLVDAQWEMQQ